MRERGREAFLTASLLLQRRDMADDTKDQQYGNDPPGDPLRMIVLGFIADLSGRLRTTTSGRSRIAAGFEN